MLVREELAAAVRRAAEELQASGTFGAVRAPEVQLDVPPSTELGDYSSNLAVELGRLTRRPSAELARELADRLSLPEGLVDRVEVAGSGILNFHLRPGWLEGSLREAARQGEAFGRDHSLGQGRAALVEFVSANPTGPLTVTHGRGAAVGDAVANLLDWSGYRVSREFYVNDAGHQMERFGRALDARYLRALGVPGRPVPSQGYLAPYLAEVTATILASVGDRYRELPAEQRLEALTQQGRDETVRRQRETLARFGVQFDDWYSEQELHNAGKLDRALAVLQESGHTYEADGALWLRTSELGDTEDFPLLRSNGQPAYLAGDLAYHLDKFSRGFDRVLDVWGPDHALYVRRTKAGVRALGHDPAALDIVIFQPVAIKVHETIIEDSGPAGNNFALDEVLEQVGLATARLLYLARPATAPLDLDLDLARDESPASPAFRLLRTRDRLVRLAAGAVPDTEADLTMLNGPADRELMRALARFPDEVRGAARALDSYPVMRYLQELTTLLEAFAPDGADVQAPARAALLSLANVVFSNGLRVLGVPGEQPA